MAVIGICPLADIRNCPKTVNSVTGRDWTLDLVRSLSAVDTADGEALQPTYEFADPVVRRPPASCRPHRLR